MIESEVFMYKKMILFLITMLVFTFSIAQASVVSQINDAIKAAGISGGYVQEENNKIYLRGNYLNEDQFITAYHIAQSIAGASNINPGYDVLYTKIAITNFEECMSAALTNNPSLCPSPLELIPNLANANATSGKYALVFGIGYFENFPNVPLGTAPFKDMKLVAKVLSQNGYKVTEIPKLPTKFTENDVRKLSSQATLYNIRKTIKEMLAKMPNGSTFVIYASSHGATPSQNGDTGIIVYDTKTQGPGCQISSIASSGSRSIVLAASNSNSNLSQANADCNVINSSFTMLGKNGIINMVEASGKKINLIVIPDVCHSGALAGSQKNVYSTTGKAATQIAGSYEYPIIFIGAASGNQESMQKNNGNGVFTYYYFSNLPENQYNAYKTYENTKSEIEKESADLCKKAGGKGCDPNGQTPVFVWQQDNSFGF
ncbi:MAG: caspase family protein [Desulfurella sp.]|jgi:hypothetical protein